ncbi:MAG: ATP-binding protein [Candidatus Dormibacteria bacterium]
MASSRRGHLPTIAAVVGAIGGPIAITALLSLPGPGTARDYVFVYVALVAVLGTLSGLRSALAGAALSFLLVDYFFVPPFHTLTIADARDLVDLVVFVTVAAVAGGVGSGRRRAQIEAEGLAARLRHTNAEMERLEREQAEAAAVAVRLAQTEQQVRVLEASDRLRTDLLANVSHELRTPLASILTGATDLLERPHLASSVRAEMDSIIGEARRLERLVSDLLDMARIEAHALTLDAVEIDLGEALEAASGRLRLASPQRPVELHLPPDGLEVLADWDRLGQILDNLLQNADRHGPAGTPLTVTAAPGKRSMVVVRVIDRGPGVPADQRELIFERFVRGVTEGGAGEGVAGPAAGGTGLGLAIVRGLVEAHAGRVWIEDPETGEGARFAFTLPAA